ncbi:hypothetical protein NQ117_12210 [Paenibacillus sp. SC116]|uniref:hypothetical protein n=1 Tax=Paenibacillus sp. SC116 TaxID=2968986 RepID=UPI00215B4FBB|nr:hypothetical protein [Paenibacillus sp. SC116]MCR8844449.1 hypothetical protein [Paenibacillus sp. SC116]
MDKKKMSLLKKLYHPTNSVFDREYGVSLYNAASLTSQERELLKEMNWMVNRLELIKHDSSVKELVHLRQDGRLYRERILNGFIAGVGGSYPRGLSPLLSYYTMKNIPEHEFVEADRYSACRICSFSKARKDGFWENASYLHYVLYLGNTYGSNPWGALLDLKELAEQHPVKPTKEDIKVFRNLLVSLDRSEPDETPGGFEKRLTAEKIMPKNKYVRRGILNSLAVIGVIPNAFVQTDFNKWTEFEYMVSQEEKLPNTKGRSDMEMPWAGWNGGLKINWDVTKELFGEIERG